MENMYLFSAICIGLFVYDASNFVGYLMQKPYSKKNSYVLFKPELVGSGISSFFLRVLV